MMSKTKSLAIATVIALTVANGAFAQNSGGIVILTPKSIGSPIATFWAGGIYTGPASWPKPKGQPGRLSESEMIRNVEPCCLLEVKSKLMGY